MQHIHTEHFKMENAGSTTLQDLRSELTAYYAALAVVVEECYAPDAGLRMLGVGPDTGPGPIVNWVNVDSTRLGKLLPIWHLYAFGGVLAAGYSVSGLLNADGPFERLSDMLGLLRTEDTYFDDALDAAGVEVKPRGHLANLVARLRARANLDGGSSVSIQELGLLADMAERSVRNALTADGENRLVTQPDGEVSNGEAKRWLAGRRGFKPSELRSFSAAAEGVPDDLLDIEIPGFVASRLTRLWLKAETTDTHDDWQKVVAMEAGLPLDRIEAAGRLPFNIRPDECEGLARVLKVDPVWFTLQVMTALFPKQVDTLLNPGHWRSAEATIPLEPSVKSVTVTLTVSMLKHGYIDFPMSAKVLFPSDCFGTRETGDEGAAIELTYGSHRESTDIRIKSARTLSPRRRFHAWLNTELGCKPGDRIVLEKTGERQFKLTHLPVAA